MISDENPTYCTDNTYNEQYYCEEFGNNNISLDSVSRNLAKFPRGVSSETPYEIIRSIVPFDDRCLYNDSDYYQLIQRSF